MRIEIIGNIASGKTTLATVLSSRFSGVFENFKENPFWEAFYEDPNFYSFETEVTFTLQHYHQIKKEIGKNENFVCDFSLILDRAYADVTLSEERREVYECVLSEIEREVGYPDLLIHLECPEKVLLNRIRSRGRVIEKTITEEYLMQLASQISSNIQLIGDKTKLLLLNSAVIDFAHNSDDINHVKSTILKLMPRGACK